MNLTDSVIEAISEYIAETAEALFDTYPLLESFSWEQGYLEDGTEFCAEEFEVNAGAYFGSDRLWRQDVCNKLRWAFDTLEPLYLLDLYGKNVRITVTRDEVEVETLG